MCGRENVVVLLSWVMLHLESLVGRDTPWRYTRVSIVT